MTAQILRLTVGPLSLRLVRRPVAVEPVPGTVCLVDMGTEDRVIDHQPARWTGTEWTRPGGGKLPAVPTHWLEMDKADG